MVNYLLGYAMSLGIRLILFRPTVKAPAPMRRKAGVCILIHVLTIDD